MGDAVMIRRGTTAQLNNDHRLPLEQGSIVFQAGAIGTIETPGLQRARVRFNDDISALVPARLLNVLPGTIGANQPCDKYRPYPSGNHLCRYCGEGPDVHTGIWP